MQRVQEVGRARIGEWARQAPTASDMSCLRWRPGCGARCVGVGAEWGGGRRAGVLVRGAADRARASPTAAAASTAPTRQRTTPTPTRGCAALPQVAPSAAGPPGTSGPPRRAGGVLARQGQRHPSASGTWRRGWEWVRCAAEAGTTDAAAAVGLALARPAAPLTNEPARLPPTHSAPAPRPQLRGVPYGGLLRCREWTTCAPGCSRLEGWQTATRAALPFLHVLANSLFLHVCTHTEHASQETIV